LFILGLSIPFETRHAFRAPTNIHPAGVCYATIGVHPCSAKTFETHPGGPTALLTSLKDLALTAKASSNAVAFGEIGLDYDRLFLTAKDQQLKYFEAQLSLAVEVQLPLFLHSRAAAEDFERLLAARLDELPKRGLVHSFTGSAEEMQRLVDMGFDVGVNGCSMKSKLPLPLYLRSLPKPHLHPFQQKRTSKSSALFLSHTYKSKLTAPGVKCGRHTHQPSFSKTLHPFPKRSRRKSGSKAPW
jgi:TatD DNase family protein